MSKGLAQMRRAANFVHDYFINVGQLPSLPPIRGTWYFVDPKSGSDTGRTGKSQEQAYATLTKAYAACTTGRGDGICIYSAGITTAETSTYLTASLDWTKWGITTVGVAAPTRFAQRTRIVNASTALALPYLIDVQGSNNAFYNLSVHNFGTNAAAVGGMKVTGHRNYFGNVHIVGGGGRSGLDTDYDLSLLGSENTFEDCVIGTDTHDKADKTNCNLLLPGSASVDGSMRCVFEGCWFLSYHSAGTTAGAIRLARSDAIHRDLLFDGCTFSTYRDGNVAAEVAVVIGTAPDNGFLIFKDCGRKGYVDWKGIDSSFAARVISMCPTNHESGGQATLANPS